MMSVDQADRLAEAVASAIRRWARDENGWPQTKPPAAGPVREAEAAHLPVGAPRTHPADGLKLTFEETWANGLDWSRWDSVPLVNNPEGRGSSLPSNKEKQWYPNARHPGWAGAYPARVDNGKLIMEARRTPDSLRHLVGYGPDDNPELVAHGFGPEWYDYVSPRIRTLHAQTYGHFSAVLECPAGKGTWPGWWALAQHMGWPPEMDMMEGYGHNPSLIQQTWHYMDAGEHKVGHVDVQVDMTQPHEYGWTWGPQECVTYVDGVETARFPTPPDFHSPMHLILDLAISGDEWLHPDDKTPFPARMKVGPVRAYALP